MKFKIGDKVRIVKNVWEYTTITPDVGIGEVHTIIGINTYNKKYPYKLDAYADYTWREDELELVEDNNMFTKKDLKNGDVIKKRNGSVEILVLPLGTLVCNDNHYNLLADINDDLTNSNGEMFDIVAVRRPILVHHCKFDAFNQEFGDLVYDRERDTKPVEPPKPLYNGKVVCIDLKGCNRTHYTVGKIYQFKDGVLTADDGFKFDDDGVNPFRTFEDWNKFSSSKFIEIKE